MPKTLTPEEIAALEAQQQQGEPDPTAGGDPEEDEDEDEDEEQDAPYAPPARKGVSPDDVAIVGEEALSSMIKAAVAEAVAPLHTRLKRMEKSHSADSAVLTGLGDRMDGIEKALSGSGRLEKSTDQTEPIAPENPAAAPNSNADTDIKKGLTEEPSGKTVEPDGAASDLMTKATGVNKRVRDFIAAHRQAPILGSALSSAISRGTVTPELLKAVEDQMDELEQSVK